MTPATRHNGGDRRSGGRSSVSRSSAFATGARCSRADSSDALRGRSQLENAVDAGCRRAPVRPQRLGELDGALVAVSGFFDSARAITSPSPRGNATPGTRSPSGIGGSITCFWMYSIGALGVERELARQHLVEDDGERIDVARARRALLPCACSGLMNSGVPKTIPSCVRMTRARPHLRSVTFAETEVEHLGVVRRSPTCWQRKMFSGLRSRWMMPGVVRLVRARRTPGSGSATRAPAGTGPPRGRSGSGSCPSRNSITM